MSERERNMGQDTVTVVGSVILLLLLSKFGVTVEVSKACYGPPGIPCTTHRLRCGSGHIAIQEAFYTNSTACGTGVSGCADINLSSIPLNGTRYNFSDTELDSLYRNCSTQSTCSHRAGRRKVIRITTFSAIIYQCIIGGMFAAGLFTGLAIAAVMVGVVYFFYIKRRCVIKKPDPGPASPNHPTYTGLTDLGRPDTYDVIDRPEAATKPSETSQTPVYQNVNNA